MPPGDIEDLYDAHAPALFAFLLNFTRDESDTRDALQELFRRLAARPSLLAGVRDARGFLLRLAHNLAVDGIRRRDARRRAHDALAAQPAELFAPSTNPTDEDLRALITEALDELPPDQRVVLQLKLWEDLTFDAIAHVLDIPLNTAASRYRYAMDKLRARLRPLHDALR
ncbi:MAG: sigma-70 family RNA polymerase sigma factor [Verrucomicrobiae bacterium]|nr:sigma-70 family RNA polymerase sigma factor [Verrucomicrobiae bacterium]